MNSRERVLAAARGGTPDLLPVGLYNGNHAIVTAGFRLGECYTDGRKLAGALLRTWERIGQDVITVQSDSYYLAEAMGSVVRYHEDGTPSLEKPFVEELADVARLRVPDPRRDGRMHVYLEAISILRDQLGSQVAIRGCGTGPFVLGGYLLGTERFLLELAQAHYGLGGSEQAIRDILQLSCDALIDFVTAQLEAGATIVQCADSSASLDLVSPEIYEKFALPYEMRFFEAVRPLCRTHEAVSLLHICGDNTKVFPLQARCGADLVEIDHKADLATAKRELGHRVALIGNLDPVGHLLFGSAQQVEQAARTCVEKAAAGGGYILGSGCEVPIHAPVENLLAAIQVARQHRYGGVAS